MQKKKKNNEINSLAEELKGEKKEHMTAFSYSENSMMRGMQDRKKNLQEKAAAKTAIRAQKESEKKLKEHEKKAKKKASAAGPDIDPGE